MIDKVITLDNGLEYYVLDEMSYEGKNYLMGLQVDNEKEGITNNYIIVESKKDINGNVTLVDIDNIGIGKANRDLFDIPEYADGWLKSDSNKFSGIGFKK